MITNLVTLGLRCTNQTAYATAPFKDLDVPCYTEEPYWKDEPDTDDEDVGGFRANTVAARRGYRLPLPKFTVADSVWSQADYEELARYTRADHLYIRSVTYNGGTHPRVIRSVTTELIVPFWNDLAAMDLPIEVRRVSLEVTDARSRFGAVLTLEDCLPTIGVEIA